MFSNESLTSEASTAKTEEESLLLHPSFDPSRIHIFHDKILMNGENAVVCKAQFLHLPCAAKYIHLKLTKSSDWQLENFKKGCKILQGCRHPNIVTFLGVHHDEGLGLPVLLMELMEHSLKAFLDQKQHLALHTQLSICYDVAQGLEYLHAESIIHGSLTSTNVLVHEGRAKIGGTMSLQHNTPDVELSLCPGAPDSLPRRSFSFADYDEAIDCFSFGVLSIHVATREMPKPLTQAYWSKINSEIERYKSSLAKVDVKHPLLPLIQECLKDDSRERPSAGKICRELSGMRKSDRYLNSLMADHVSTKLVGLQLQYTQDKVKTLQTEIEDKKSELEQQHKGFEETLCFQKQQAKGEQERLINTNQMLVCQNRDLEEKKEAASREIDQFKREMERTKKSRSEETIEKDRMRKDLWTERDKTQNMEQKIQDLQKEKADYKQKLEESDANLAKHLQEQQ